MAMTKQEVWERELNDLAKEIAEDGNGTTAEGMATKLHETWKEIQSSSEEDLPDKTVEEIRDDLLERAEEMGENESPTEARLESEQEEKLDEEEVQAKDMQHNLEELGRREDEGWPYDEGEDE